MLSRYCISDFNAIFGSILSIDSRNDFQYWQPQKFLRGGWGGGVAEEALGVLVCVGSAVRCLDVVPIYRYYAEVISHRFCFSVSKKNQYMDIFDSTGSQSIKHPTPLLDFWKNTVASFFFYITFHAIQSHHST